METELEQLMDGAPAVRRLEAELSAEKQLLELVARGVALPAVLEALCGQVEALAPGCACSIVRVDPALRTLEFGAAPTMPDDYRAMLRGAPVDPAVGAYSLAVETKAPVFVADLAADDRWKATGWARRMGEIGYASCWSTPILSASQEVLGVFAVYRPEPRGPTPSEQELIGRFTHIAGIAMERAQADANLRQREAELARTHDFLNEAQRLSQTGSFTWDAHPEKQFWSDEMYRTLELEPGTLVTLEMARGVIHPDDLPTYDAMVARGQAGEQMEATYRIVTPSGAVKHLRTMAHRLTQVTDRPVYLGASQDVTDSKLAEEALEAREGELRQVNQHLVEAQKLSRVGSFTADVHRDEHTFSDELLRIWEFDPGVNITGADVRQRLHPDDLPAFEAEFARVAAGGESDFAFRIVTPSGKTKHLRSVARLLEYVDGRPIHMGVQQDETERVLAAEALSASERELRAAHALLTEAQRLTKVGSFTWDVLADRHNWSDQIHRVFDIAPGVEVTVAMIQAMIVPDDTPAVEAAIRRAYEGRPFEVAFRIVAADGAIRHVRVIAHRDEQIADRIVFIGALQDVTESKQAEAALDRAREELAHVSRMATLSMLTASIAHEVNQPLAGIITNANTCLRMLAAEPPNVEGARATAQRTIRDGNRAAEVIRRLRALFSERPEAREPVDLNNAVREVFALSAGELQRGRVALRMELADGLPPVMADRVQLQQVILNLALNATEAMSGVEGRARELTVVSAPDGDGGVRLSVRDAGVGVPPQGLEKLFEAFHTTKPTGMGVGLSISRSIIESHEGRLWAEPNDGLGATFAFTLPARPASGPAGSAA
jgi:C4-dicarboxylate-specific signal transduction histidine kinase